MLFDNVLIRPWIYALHEPPIVEPFADTYLRLSRSSFAQSINSKAWVFIGLNGHLKILTSHAVD